jgi:hypothetical protein
MADRLVTVAPLDQPAVDVIGVTQLVDLGTGCAL